MEEQYLKKADILNAVKSLSHSQGFYCRLLNNLDDDFLEELEEQHFKDIVNLVMYLEC